MAIDYGDAHTGIAISDPTGLLAGYTTTIHSRKAETVLEEIRKLVQKHGVGKLVMGLPRNMDGTEGPRAALYRDFAARVEETSGLPVVLWDERRTTVDAHRILFEAGKDARKRKKTVDAVAASLILEGYLTFLKSGHSSPAQKNENQCGRNFMEIKTVWGAYFSATGTTKKVVTALARAAADGLGAEYKVFPFDNPAVRKAEKEFSADDLVIMGVPVYAGRVPNLIMPYIRDLVKGNGALAVPVVLYGNRNFDDALIELRNLMRDNGFHPIAGAAVVGEHSFSKILGAGRPDADDMALVAKLADGVIKKVSGLKEAPAEAVEVEGQDPIRPYYTPRDRHGEPIKDFLKAKPVTDPEKCIHCGLCARICPMGSIDPEDFSNVAGKCIKCCACVKRCPAGAKYFDHEGYLYHQHELEAQYAGRRADSKIFL